jgi:hypothetical protein
MMRDSTGTVTQASDSAKTLFPLSEVSGQPRTTGTSNDTSAFLTFSAKRGSRSCYSSSAVVWSGSAYCIKGVKAGLRKDGTEGLQNKEGKSKKAIQASGRDLVAAQVV